jgi:cytochrome c
MRPPASKCSNDCAPPTRMAFVGIKNDKDIADLWAYLKQFGPEGAKK